MFDSDYDQSVVPSQESFHISYAIEMSKLAILCELPQTMIDYIPAGGLHFL